MNDMIYNMKINRLFKSLTVLVRDIKKDVIENKKEDYKKRIDIIHKEAMEIPDEIIASIPKIDIDESKISLHQFKMNPYNYIRLLTEHFYMEKKKTFDIVNKIESQFITIGLQLKEEYHNNIEMYKSIIRTKALEKLQTSGQCDPIVVLDKENEKIVLKMGEQTVSFDLNI